jgi:hypothetical protein
MKNFFIILILILVVKVMAAESAVSVIDVRRSLPMEPSEKSTREFYLNAGSDMGLKVGAYVDVIRFLQVQDPTANKQMGVLKVPIGKLKIIHVEKGLSVARTESELSNNERPVVEYETIMIGDQIDMSSISTQKPSSTKKKNSWL